MRRIIQIAGQIVVEHPHVASPLNVWLTAQGVDAASRFAHVAKEELQNGERADALHTRRMLSHSESIQDGPGPVLGHRFCNFPDLRCGDSRDAFTHFECVSGDEGFQACKNTVGVI